MISIKIIFSLCFGDKCSLGPKKMESTKKLKSSKTNEVANSLAPWCASHCRVKLHRGVHHTTESSDQRFFKNSAV